MIGVMGGEKTPYDRAGELTLGIMTGTRDPTNLGDGNVRLRYFKFSALIRRKGEGRLPMGSTK